MRAGSLVATGLAGTFVHVSVTVSTFRLAAVRNGACRLVNRNEVVCTHAIRKPLGAPACVGVIGNRTVAGGVAATGPVLAWIAVALVDVQIAVGVVTGL